MNYEWIISCALRRKDDEIARLTAENARLRAASERVCWFDWSGNDQDAVAAVNDLREALNASKGKSE